MTPTLTFGEALAALREEAVSGEPAPGTPTHLAPRELHLEAAVFQPRNFDGDMAASEDHRRALMDAIRHAPDHQVDPVLVWWSGKRWVVIDGHHRADAYRRLASDPKKPLEVPRVAVEVFAGTVEAAIAEAAARNSRDKLPMTQADKLEMAWRLVALRDDALSKRQIALAASVAESTVALMRAALRKLLAEDPQADPFGWTWRDLRSGGEKPDRDDGWKEAQARDWARRFSRTHGRKLSKHPDIAARALEIYSAHLPAKLVEVWHDLVRAYVEDHDNPDF